MKSEGQKRGKKIRIQPDWKWITTIFGTTIGISAAMSFLSNEVLNASGMLVSFVVLLAIIFVGVIFDIIGVAVTAADTKPFFSMASHRTKGAKEAIWLINNANKVSSICNDVVGDICGVVSGSASATIAAQILANFDFSWPQIVSLLMSALAAGLTVGGKAIGKSFAVNSSTMIVHSVGKLLHGLHSLKGSSRKKKK